MGVWGCVCLKIFWVNWFVKKVVSILPPPGWIRVNSYLTKFQSKYYTCVNILININETFDFVYRIFLTILKLYYISKTSFGTQFPTPLDGSWMAVGWQSSERQAKTGFWLHPMLVGWPSDGQRNSKGLSSAAQSARCIAGRIHLGAGWSNVGHGRLLLSRTGLWKGHSTLSVLCVYQLFVIVFLEDCIKIFRNKSVLLLIIFVWNDKCLMTHGPRTYGLM